MRRAVALNRIHRLGHRFRRRQIPQAPASHGIGFTEPVHRDREIVGLFRERGDADVLYVVIDQLLVDLIRQDVDVLFGRYFHDLFHLFARVNRSRGIARAVHDQHLGARRHGIFEIVCAHLPAIPFHGRNDHRIGSGQSDHVGVADPIRRGNQHFVARLTSGQDGIVTGVLGAIADHDLAGAIAQFIIGGQLFGDGLTQLGNAGTRRVFGETGIQRFDTSGLDVLGRVEIGFARSESADVQPLCFHRLGFAVDRKGERGGQLRRA